MLLPVQFLNHDKASNAESLGPIRTGVALTQGQGHTTYLCGHDQARSSWIDGHITGHQSNVSKVGKKFSIFLIAESLANSQ